MHPVRQGIRLEENVHAIELTVAALRGLERWGAKEMVDAAFRGFQSLPPGDGGGGPPEWWSVLGVERTAGDAQIDAAYRAKAKQRHPDAGGDDESFKLLGEAYRRAKTPT